MANIQDSPKNQSTPATNGGDLTVTDIWPTPPQGGAALVGCRSTAALKAAAAKVARLEQQLGDRDKRIKDLESLAAALAATNEDLDSRLLASESENEENAAATGAEFAALIAALDDLFGIRFFPIDLQLRIEAVVGRLGVVRRW